MTVTHITGLSKVCVHVCISLCVGVCVCVCVLYCCYVSVCIVCRHCIRVYIYLSTGFEHGPLSILKRSVREKLKVRVWTRSVRNIRGICTGYVVAFDKHMNLVSYFAVYIITVFQKKMTKISNVVLMCGVALNV